MTTRRIELGPVSIAVDDTGGDGPPVVAIHGWLGTRRTWSGVVSMLSPRYRVVSLDLRGHGESSVPSEGFASTDMAGDVAGVIRHLELGPAILLAHSMGTSVATRVAVDSRELVSALVLVDPDYGGDPSHRRDLAAIAHQADDQTVKAGVTDLFRTRIDAATRDVTLRKRHLDDVMATPARVVAETLRANIDVSVSIRFRQEAEALLPTRPQPALSFHRLAERARWERAHATHSASHALVVPSAGHWIHEERPDLVLGHMTTWLAGIRATQKPGGR